MKKVLKKLVAVALGAGFVLGAAVSYSIFPPRHEVVETYQVKDGDTLWRICAKYCEKDCREIRVTQMVEEVTNLNPYLKTRDGLVLTGDKIKICYMALD